MDLTLTAEQTLLRDTARELATKEILPHAAELDRAHQFPRALVSRLGSLGLLGVMVPEKWGGAGMDAVSYALALE
ncbi:MAG TPA: acyl-CoA dehydrogenase family protein, partial [Polyangia bacterium]|nr:acyl-CoA dehydrogenase family protein [Polyangia bacterium]